MARGDDKKSAADPKPLKILYVEDTPADAELCLHDLKKAGFEPHADVVSTPAEFKEKLRSKPYDVILSDCSLPQFSAMEALEVVKQEAPDLPFILVTGTLGDEGAVEAIKQGATDYVLKDRRARLAYSVRRALEDKRLRQVQKLADEALAASEVRYRRLFESAKDGILILDAETGMIVDVNPFLAELLGTPREHVLRKHVWDLGCFKDILANKTLFEELQRKDYVRYESLPLETADGQSIDVEFVSNVYLADGKKVIQCNVRDITERKRAERELRRLNRALRTISECNEALVRAQGEQELLDQICQILLDKGRFRMVWAGYGVPDDPVNVRPVAHAGNEEAYLATAYASRDDAGHGRWPCVEAIRTGQVCIVRTTSAEPTYEAWRALAERQGFASTIALPLNLNGRPMGALTLDAAELEAFDGAEVQLLTELANDLAFGIQSHRTHAERKQAEANIRTARDEWELTFNTVPDPILVLDEECRIRRANRAAASLAGLQPDQVLGKHCYEIIHGQADPRGDCPHQELIQTGFPAQGDVYEAWLDKFFASTVTPLLDQHGALRGCVHVLHDITARRRAEDDLRHSEELFEVFMDHSPAIAWMKDAEGRYVYCNKKFESSFNVTQAGVIGRTDSELWSVEIAQKHREDDLAVLATGKPLEFEEPIPDPSAQREAWVTKFPFHDPLGRMLVGGKAIEITEHKRLEAQLRQSQKLEAIGQLAGGVAHDFNNLLTIISGYSELLAGGLSTDGPRVEQVKQIQNAADRAAGLTRQLLAFGRRQTLAPEVVDLNSVVARVDKMLRRLIGEDIDLITRPDPGLGHVRADPGQIEQVIMNLAVNARDAMPQGGKLTVETANIQILPGDTRCDEGLQVGSYVALSVADNGLGIAPNIKTHIFEPFFTTKEKGKGTGLGLATVYGIVQQSGGAISVDSELGRGSTFHIFLPRVEAALVPEELETATVTHQPHTETVLVVEDDESLRTMVRGVLESCGYQVLEATNGADALSLCEHFAGPIHLLLTDVVMPQMGGPELANRLTARRPHIRVFYMSGYTDGTITFDGNGGVKHAFIAKPFTPKGLARRVRELLDSIPQSQKAA
jgi:PAS domain S-box-containing protein